MRPLYTAGLLCLLGVASVSLAAASPDTPDALLARRGGRELLAPIRGRIEEDNTRLETRQAPPITTTPKCNDFDGFFYLTPRNYTWQLQCSTNYDGSVVSQANAANYSDCILQCVNYNRASIPGACLAITFNGPSDGATGLCTLYADVANVFLASEEGNVQDSALLILGPNGQIFATPQPEPTFVGAPTEPPINDPLPTSTTSSGEIVSMPPPPLPLTTSASPSLSTILTALSVTTTMTSTISVTSCPSESMMCFQSSTTSVSSPGNVGPSPTPTQASSFSSIEISDGGSRPAPSTSQTTSMSGALTFDAVQATMTTVVTYTEYRVQIIEICAATPTPCSQSTRTSTSVGYRTELSCSPGACSGVVLATSLMADFGGTCIIP